MRVNTYWLLFLSSICTFLMGLYVSWDILTVSFFHPCIAPAGRYFHYILFFIASACEQHVVSCAHKIITISTVLIITDCSCSYAGLRRVCSQYKYEVRNAKTARVSL